MPNRLRIKNVCFLPSLPLCRPFAGMKVRFCLCLIYQSSSCTIPRSSSSLSYDEHIFSYRVRTPNAILIRNDKQSGNDRSTEEKRTISIACSCQNGYVRKSEPKLIGT